MSNETCLKCEASLHYCGGNIDWNYYCPNSECERYGLLTVVTTNIHPKEAHG